MCNLPGYSVRRCFCGTSIAPSTLCPSPPCRMVRSPKPDSPTSCSKLVGSGSDTPCRARVSSSKSLLVAASGAAQPTTTARTSDDFRAGRRWCVERVQRLARQTRLRRQGEWNDDGGFQRIDAHRLVERCDARHRDRLGGTPFVAPRTRGYNAETLGAPIYTSSAGTWSNPKGNSSHPAGGKRPRVCRRLGNRAGLRVNPVSLA